VEQIFNIDPIDIQLLVSVKCQILLVDLLKQEISTFFDKTTADRSKSSLDYQMAESYYGITWDSEKQIVYIVGSEPEVEDGRYLKTKLCKLTPNGELIDFIPIEEDMEFGCAHQIHYHDGFVFVADTLYNCVKKIDPSTGGGQSLKIDPKRFGKDFDHINSVWVDDHIYVLGNGRTGSTIPRIYIFDRDNYGLLGSVQQGIAGAHNIARLWDQRVVLASYKGALVGEKNQILIQAGRFARGLSITDDYVFIGQSIIAEREARLNSNAGWISVHNNKDGTQIGNIKLSNAGQVHEVRCLNQKDYAHNGTTLWK